MKKVKLVKKQIEVIDDILCNKCGKSCKEDCGEDVIEYCGLIETTIEGGYFSPVLEDAVKYTFSLCEECLNELFKTFKIEVESGGEYWYNENVV